MRAYQIAALNQGFTPTDEETAHATSVLAAFAAAQAEGSASTRLDGEVIDATRAATAANLITWGDLCARREQGRATVVAQTRATSGS